MRHSAWITARQEDASSESLVRLKAQGISVTPGMDLSQLQSLVNVVIYQTPVQDVHTATSSPTFQNKT